MSRKSTDDSFWRMELKKRQKWKFRIRKPLHLLLTSDYIQVETLRDGIKPHSHVTYTFTTLMHQQEEEILDMHLLDDCTFMSCGVLMFYSVVMQRLQMQVKWSSHAPFSCELWRSVACSTIKCVCIHTWLYFLITMSPLLCYFIISINILL